MACVAFGTGIANLGKKWRGRRSGEETERKWRGNGEEAESIGALSGELGSKKRTST
jgi:hypothetical protein